MKFALGAKLDSSRKRQDLGDKFCKEADVLERGDAHFNFGRAARFVVWLCML